MPTSRLVLRVQDTEGRWQSHPGVTQPHAVLAPQIAEAILGVWSSYSTDVTGHHGMAISGRGQAPLAWFLGVAPAQAPRYAVAVLIERSADPRQAIEIGAALLQAASRR